MRAQASRRRPWRGLGAAIAGLLLLAAPARATWSIVVVNVETGEVGIASATCLAGFDLQRWLPVVVPGEGVAAAQSIVDQSGNNRILIWNGIQDGLTPAEILAALAAQDGQHNGRQYGIVNMLHEPLTYTGGSVGQARHGVSGRQGPWRYAVQGNVLTGAIVVEAAASELLATEGDMGQKLMAAMMEARRYGGDGRCSCSGLWPTSCGAPPPSFEKSSHVAFIIVARLGDTLGTCNVNTGCANGDYYLGIQKITGVAGPDPVLVLRDLYTEWRQDLSGRPDHLLSTVQADAQALVADGRSRAEVRVRLFDVDGVAVGAGGATLSVESTAGGVPVAVPGPVVDLGGGEYTFTLTATEQPGQDAFRITVDDGLGSVRLYPDLPLRVDPPARLHVGFDAISAGEEADVPFVLNLGPANAGRPYLLLGTARGTQPGQVLHGLSLPLNPDEFFHFTLGSAGSPALPDSQGTLDGLGRATARYRATPLELAPLAGRKLTWAAVIGGPAPLVTPTVEFSVLP